MADAKRKGCLHPKTDSGNPSGAVGSVEEDASSGSTPRLFESRELDISLLIKENMQRMERIWRFFPPLENLEFQHQLVCCLIVDSGRDSNLCRLAFVNWTFRGTPDFSFHNVYLRVKNYFPEMNQEELMLLREVCRSLQSPESDGVDHFITIPETLHRKYPALPMTVSNCLKHILLEMELFKSNEARRIRQCQYCFKVVARTKKCTQCLQVRYCSRECQKEDWA